MDSFSYFNMYKLDCEVQKYDWGRIGNESSVAKFKSVQNSSFTIDSNHKYAELWMGTHPKGPTKILNKCNEMVDLSNYLKERKDEAIGETISAHFYTPDSLMKHGDLPFLFKVLSINKALSIQAHPNKKHAIQLHARDPKNYPDANHKPEMIIAISDKFEAMCGFRLASEISQHFQTYSQLKTLCGEENCDKFIKENSTESLAECLRSLMSQDSEFVKKQFESLSTNLSTKANLNELEQLFVRLSKQYPNDVGCFVVFLLNCFTLNKGEAIYLGANVPHAYLLGEGVECMACSDNVVRAGLTPKFKDVETLCSMLDYSMRSANDNKLASTRTEFSQDKTYLTEFRPTVDEFSIQQIRIEKCHLKDNNKFILPKSKSGSILILVETGSESGRFETKDNSLEAKVGLVYFIDANTDVYYNLSNTEEVGSDKDVLLAYRAYCDIKA